MYAKKMKMQTSAVIEIVIVRALFSINVQYTMLKDKVVEQIVLIQPVFLNLHVVGLLKQMDMKLSHIVTMGNSLKL